MSNLGTNLTQLVMKLDIIESGQVMPCMARSYEEVKCNGPPACLPWKKSPGRRGEPTKENGQGVTGTPQPTRSPGDVDRNF